MKTLYIVRHAKSSWEYSGIKDIDRPLKNRGIEVLGIVFNGETNEETEKYILNYSNLKCLGRIEQHSEINKEIVLSYKSQFKGV